MKILTEKNIKSRIAVQREMKPEKQHTCVRHRPRSSERRRGSRAVSLNSALSVHFLPPAKLNVSMRVAACRARSSRSVTKSTPATPPGAPTSNETARRLNASDGDRAEDDGMEEEDEEEEDDDDTVTDLADADDDVACVCIGRLGSAAIRRSRLASSPSAADRSTRCSSSHGRKSEGLRWKRLCVPAASATAANATLVLMAVAVAVAVAASLVLPSPSDATDCACALASAAAALARALAAASASATSAAAARSLCAAA